ncbi:MAG: hypothetical protein SFU53_00675 [Terrimicrobiaceae bacterium]|nr:hypothetical protein [Terrimicrobiaceae bacterium]
MAKSRRQRGAEDGRVLVAIPPFDGAEDGHKAIARGFWQDLLAELARFPAIGVLAPESAAALGSGLNEASRWGARFVVRGGLRTDGPGIRVHARLAEADSGCQVWAGRFDVEDLPAAHDELTGRLVNAIAAQLNKSLLSEARRRPVESLEAYDCYLRGMECIHRGSAGSDDEARRFFERALELDPHFAAAQAGVSLSHFNEWSCQTWQCWEAKEVAAYEAACRAAEMDPDLPVALVILARIEQYRRRFDAAAPRLRRALALAPNDASILILLAAGFACDGDGETGRELARRALTLNPLGPAWYHAYAAIPAFALGDFEEVFEETSRVPRGSIVDTPAYRAAAAAVLGRPAEAAVALTAFREEFASRIAPGRRTSDDELLAWLMHVNPFRDPALSRRLADGVKAAGLAVDKVGPAAPAVSWPTANTFRLEGGAWTLVYEHVVAVLPDLRGLHDIARLLSEPGREIGCMDLVGAGLAAAEMPALDIKALAAYRERLRDLDAEVEAGGDAETLAEEREALLREISRATGLTGTRRGTGGSQERARTTVAWRIRHAIRRIEVVHPTLGLHLRNSIRTGAFCEYRPERPVSWRV